MADNRTALHQGQATERDVKSASARVGFDDLSGTVSGFMQVLFPAAGGWNFFYTPKEGDQVVVSRLPNGAEEGYILGKVYTAGKMPQGGEPNVILLASDNGKNVVKFDADKGTLDLICDQDCSLKANNLNIEVKEHVDIKANTASVEAKESATVKANEVLVEGGEKVTVKAPEVIVDGADTKITGGKLTTKGTAAPNGQGPYCGLPKCLFTGADQTGDTVIGT
ncbi:MAG: phage baseplate assembly protein V [Treponema sp.]|nr:phage baseplate assembly protein V [Treponema sp.]